MSEHLILQTSAEDHAAHTAEGCGGTACERCGCCMHCSDECYCSANDGPVGMLCGDGCTCEGR